MKSFCGYDLDVYNKYKLSVILYHSIRYITSLYLPTSSSDAHRELKIKRRSLLIYFRIWLE